MKPVSSRPRTSAAARVCPNAAMVPSGSYTKGALARPSSEAAMFRAATLAARTACCARAGYTPPFGAGVAAQSPMAHTCGWLTLRRAVSVTIRPFRSRSTSIAEDTGLGTIPGASTMVSASTMPSFHRTRPGSMATTGVEVCNCAPRRPRIRAAYSARNGFASGISRSPASNRWNASSRAWMPG
jgi:hypothetical protein